MAADVLRLNICAKLNVSNSIRLLCKKSATTPIPKPLEPMQEKKRHADKFLAQRHILTYDRSNFEFLKGKAETLNSRH